jgi:hypothetical protein
LAIGAARAGSINPGKCAFTPIAAGFRRWNANYSHESGFERSGGIVPAWEPRRAELKPLSGVASAEWQKHKPVADVNKTAPVWRVDWIMKSGTKLGRPANRKLR